MTRPADSVVDAFLAESWRGGDGLADDQFGDGFYDAERAADAEARNQGDRPAPEKAPWLTREERGLPPYEGPGADLTWGDVMRPIDYGDGEG